MNARLIVLFTDRALYGRALACFYPVFKTLEEALEACVGLPEMDRFAAVLSPAGLYRTQGLEEDLAYYLGENWREVVGAPAPAILAYTEHLRELGEGKQVAALLAHSFTQHLALASGGQVIKRMARKHMGLPEDKGTAAFDYNATSPNTLKNAFMAALDGYGTTLGDNEWDAMMHEHRLAFAHNNAIIRQFRLGWWPFLRGLVRLVPPIMHLGGVLVLALLAYMLWLKYGGGGL